MNLHSDIDYKNNVFELPELTRIYGEEDWSETIQKVDEEEEELA